MEPARTKAARARRVSSLKCNCIKSGKSVLFLDGSSLELREDCTWWSVCCKAGAADIQVEVEDEHQNANALRRKERKKPDSESRDMREFRVSSQNEPSGTSPA